MKKILIIIVIALLTFVGFTAYYYKGVYRPTEAMPHEIADITMESYYTGAVLAPTFRGRGNVIFDRAHDNDFLSEEINPLRSKLSEMGMTIDFLEDDDSLENKLKYADVFVVISPTKAYTTGENSQVKKFLEKKGRLIMISDPAREDEINSLSSNLGIVFKNDYLYNTVEHGGNFRYVFLDDFSSNPITEDLETVIFYVSASISSEKGIAYAKEGTRSSMEGDGRYSAISMAKDNVLAIGDLTFMTEPYNLALDNERLIMNIANYMLESKREHTLEDFPYILDSPLDVVYSNKSLIDEAISARSIFSRLGIDAEIADRDKRKDMLYLGYFDDFEDGDRGLEGVYLTNESIEVTGVGTFDKSGTVLIHLSTKSFRKALTVLSEEEAQIKNVVDILENGEIGSYMFSDNIAILRYEPVVEEVVEEEEPLAEEVSLEGVAVEEEETVEELPNEEEPQEGDKGPVEKTENPSIDNKASSSTFVNEC
ncbi:MAG: hypothetical protein V3R82_07745 [Candidatus Hydrothermarchaeales archaeon]